MKEHEDTALQAFMRLCIMVGVVVVGAMAYRVYGPPVGDLAGLLDRMVDTAKSAVGSSEPPTKQPQAAGPPVFDSALLGQLAPASSNASTADMVPLNQPMAELPPLLPVGERGLTLPTSVTPLVEQLRGLGAGQFQLAPWGGQHTMQRFVCRAPLPGESGFFRHFEAVATDAQSAVAQVVQDVTQWRAALR